MCFRSSGEKKIKSSICRTTLVVLSLLTFAEWKLKSDTFFNRAYIDKQRNMWCTNGDNNTSKKEPIKRNLSALNGMTSESCDFLHYLIKFHGTISQFTTFNWSVSLV